MADAVWPMQSMQIIALGSGNPVSGAAAMLMFSLGTVPLMLGFGSLDTSEAENTESDAEKRKQWYMKLLP